LSSRLQRARGSVAPQIAGFAVLFRGCSAVLAFFLNVLLRDYQREQSTVFGATHPFWDALARNDSGWR
jgi:hypothetical protein